jgi:hypothetical protein
MQMVQASQDEAQLAVRLYNDPAESRSFEAFIVHMHVAWLYLLHAEFARDKVDCRYWRTIGKRRFLDRIDGEPKQWELARSVRERWLGDHEPVRANLEFFIGLRNKIEHRYARRAQLALTAILGGQAQALLLNYEEELVAQFGVEHSLATRLRFPVFIGSFTTTGEQALLRLRKQLPAALRTYIAGYEASLSASVVNDPRFELRLRVFQELAPKAGPDTLPIQYTRFDDMTDEQKAAVEDAGKKGLVVTKERQRAVLGHGLWKPKLAAAEVEKQIPFAFNVAHFTQTWKTLSVRPPYRSAHPEQTDEKYCFYDELHNDYAYTDAYIKKLVRDCSTDVGFRKVVGKTPRSKRTKATSAALASAIGSPLEQSA